MTEKGEDQEERPCSKESNRGNCKIGGSSKREEKGMEEKGGDKKEGQPKKTQFQI